MNESTRTVPEGPDEGFLTKAQLAERVGVSMRTLESWMAKRMIPYVKIGKTVRFRWLDVEDTIKRNFGIGYAPFAPGFRSQCVADLSNHAAPSSSGSSRGGDAR